MSLEVHTDSSGLTVDLPDQVRVDLPEGVATAVSDVARRAQSLEPAESLREVTTRARESLRVLPRGLRLPIVGRPPTLAALEALLHRRDREVAALRAQANRNLGLGLAVGALAGAAAVIVLLPEREKRIAELRARLGGLDAPAEYVEDVRRLAARARAVVTARIEAAREESRQVREATERELWAEFEVAKREGHVPPPPPTPQPPIAG